MCYSSLLLATIKQLESLAGITDLSLSAVVYERATVLVLAKDLGMNGYLLTQHSPTIYVRGAQPGYLAFWLKGRLRRFCLVFKQVKDILVVNLTVRDEDCVHLVLVNVKTRFVGQTVGEVLIRGVAE